MEKNRNYMHAFFFCFCRFWQLQKEAISAIMRKRTANQTGRGITGKYKIRTMENRYMKKYDYLVVGAGLYGAVFANQAKAAGRKVLVVEKRPHIAGNIYTEEMEGIQVHH